MSHQKPTSTTTNWISNSSLLWLPPYTMQRIHGQKADKAPLPQFGIGDPSAIVATTAPPWIHCRDPHFIPNEEGILNPNIPGVHETFPLTQGP